MDPADRLTCPVIQPALRSFTEAKRNLQRRLEAPPELHPHSLRWRCPPKRIRKSARRRLNKPTGRRMRPMSHHRRNCGSTAARRKADSRTRSADSSGSSTTTSELIRVSGAVNYFAIYSACRKRRNSPVVLSKFQLLIHQSTALEKLYKIFFRSKVIRSGV